MQLSLRNLKDIVASIEENGCKDDCWFSLIRIGNQIAVSHVPPAVEEVRSPVLEEATIPPITEEEINKLYELHISRK